MLRIGSNLSQNLSPLHKSQQLFERTIERIASGFQINRAADNPAGLAVSQVFRSQLRGLQQASQNASQAINFVQTANGGLSEISDVLLRMRELAVQATSAGLNDTDRDNINQEFTQLRSEIDRVANSTDFNGTPLLNGTFSGNNVSFTSSNTSQTLTTSGVQEITLSGADAGVFQIVDTDAADNAITLGNGTTTQTITLDSLPGPGETVEANFDDLGVTLTLNDAFEDGGADGLTFEVVEGEGVEIQVGADNDPSDQLNLQVGNATSSGLSLVTADLSTAESAGEAIDEIDSAIDAVNAEVTNLGAVQNRIDSAISNLEEMSQNIANADRTIRNANLALEAVQLVGSQIRTQSGLAALVHQNISARSILNLLT